jgi:hypothetical protein
MEVNGQLHASIALLPGKSDPGTHWIGGWVGPRVGLEVVEKGKNLTTAGIRNLDRSARSPSLY